MAATDAEQNSRGVVGVVLAAGAGSRLRPLTFRRPKALCPVAGTPLVDLALARVLEATDSAAVNIHHGRAQLEAHLSGRPSVHLSIEEPVALGTAGALGLLRPWIDGRGVLVVNADAWVTASLGAFVAEWDGERVRVLVAGERGFGPHTRVAASLLPWSEVERLDAVPSGLYERCWRAAQATGRLEAVPYRGPFVDCGTPAQYLAANLQAVRLGRAELPAGEVGASIVGPDAVVTGPIEDSVIGAGARVEGRVRASVVWDGAEVGPTERLDHAIRTDSRFTVLVRDPHP